MIKLDEKAKFIKKKYLNKRYIFGPSSPIDEETQNVVSRIFQNKTFLVIFKIQ